MYNKFKASILFSFDIFLSVFFVFILGLFVTNYSFIFRSEVSNLTNQALIFISCLFIRWLLDKKSFDNSILVTWSRYLNKINDKNKLILISASLFVIFLYIGIMRHLAFSSAGIDMGVSDQAVWNTLKGQVLFSSLDGHINHLGSHFEPILFLITPFYFIWPNIIVLIFLQALALALAVWPLYLIAKARLSSKFLVFAFIFAYFLSRPLRGVGLLDFHTDAFLIPLAFLSYYLLITKRNFWAIVSLLLMLCCKESAAVLVFGYGIFSITYLKRYRFGLGLLLLAIIWWVLVTNFIMPYFAHTKAYPYLKWLPFGATYSDNILAVVRNPLLMINLFFSSEKTAFYSKLFMPLALLSFFSPRHYILFFLPLLTQVIGSVYHGGMVSITGHYPAHILPFIFIAAIYGAANLVDFFKGKPFLKADRLKNIPVYLGVVIILFSLFFYGKGDGHKLTKFIQSGHSLESSKMRQALRIIPPTASVLAVHRIVPHLSHRKYIYIWESDIDTRYLVEYVVLHRQLIENEKDRFDQIIYQLKEKGFKEVYSDEHKDFYIFYNPLNKIELLERLPGKFILEENG